MKRAFILALVVASCLMCACIGGSEEKTAWDVEVYGAVSNPQVLTYQQLEGLEQKEIEKQLVSGVEHYTGASLAAVYDLVGVNDTAAYVNFIASDGYILTFNPEEIGEGILALEREGELLSNERGGPVMLAVGIGCACNWMKQVVAMEFMTASEAFGIEGDVNNPIKASIRDIRDFTGKENDFTARELFDKVASFVQAQTFLIHTDGGSHEYAMDRAADVVITYEGGAFRAAVDDTVYTGVTGIECVWDPDA
ncbi:MAG: molybdopterin-dependent oxidoreductase [Candidatus Methanofastidiosa archaeon]|nr:molybdopterin-dependent oxidoreductase [Candidatus Methanofastidiosa archaeon]